MKKIVLVFALLISVFSIAQNKNAKATIEVDGICNMCKARIEKGALKTKGVKSAIWNLETKELNVIFNEEKTSVKTIAKKVASVGHDTKIVKATDEAYNTVHPCCRYRDQDVINEH
jgi:mercuric ion binding protein